MRGTPAGNLQASLNSLAGLDLSDVRIHQDAPPGSLSAHAYTQGNEVHAKTVQYHPTAAPRYASPPPPAGVYHDPRGPTGNSLLGHELTHVVQHGGGR